MSVTHAFVNPKADGADATITRPSDWNAAHVGAPTLAEVLAAGNIADLAIKSGNGTLHLFGSDGAVNTDGDTVVVRGGEADDGNGADGGSLSIEGGNSTSLTGVGGAVTLKAGFGDTGKAGGDLTLKGGDGDFLNNPVGASIVLSGANGVSTPGTVTLNGLVNFAVYSQAAGAPGGTLTTLLYGDTTAVTGGLYVWNGSSYRKVTGVLP